MLSDVRMRANKVVVKFTFFASLIGIFICINLCRGKNFNRSFALSTCSYFVGIKPRCVVLVSAS